MTQTVDPEKSSGHVPRSFSVENLLREHRTDGPITSGALIDKLLGTHQPPYLGDELIPEPVAALGPSRTVAGHVDVAQRRWDGEQIVEFHGRHLLLALAMDAGVGWPLLRSGVIAEIRGTVRLPGEDHPDPVHLLPLDDALVRTMITGLTGLPTAPPAEPAHAPAPSPDGESGKNVRALAGDGETRALAAERKRTSRAPLPAEVLKITQDEATAMSAVAPLMGTTPRTVKRFVNTYRLLKARADDPADFSHPQGAIGDHEVVAFLLAVVTGRPAVYRGQLPRLCRRARTPLREMGHRGRPVLLHSLHHYHSLHHCRGRSRCRAGSVRAPA
jgi:hypothetical protein